MTEVISQVYFSMAHSTAIIADTVNWHCWDIAITIDEHAWLFTEHLKTPPLFNHKLATYFVGSFPVLCAIGSVFFQLQPHNDWAIHNVFHASQIKPALGVVDASDTPFHPEADDSS